MSTFIMLAFHDLPIKRKLTLIILLTSSIVLLLACAAFVIYDQITFRRSMIDDLDTLAEIIGENSRGALSFGVPKAGKEVLAALKARPHIVAAGLYKDG